MFYNEAHSNQPRLSSLINFRDFFLLQLINHQKIMGIQEKWNCSLMRFFPKNIQWNSREKSTNQVI